MIDQPEPILASSTICPTILEIFRVAGLRSSGQKKYKGSLSIKLPIRIKRFESIELKAGNSFGHLTTR